MRTTMTAIVAALGLLLAVPALPARAGRVPRKNSPDQEHPKRPEGKGFGLAMPNLSESPLFQRAAEVPPRPPESYERKLPERVAGFVRKEMTGRTRWFGPAGTSEVHATWADEQGNTIRLDLVDPGGLPPEMSPRYRPFPAPGEREKVAGTIREGITIADCPGVAEYQLGERGGKIEIVVGPRVRLTVSSANVRPVELRAFLEALPLREIAALAPEPTPDFSDLLPKKD